MVAEYRPSSLDTSHHRKAHGEACSSASGTLRKKRGLRISEALALTREDVDLRNGLLTIRGAKFGKTRLVPLHPSACRALSRYAQQRDELLSPPRATNFLLCASGRPPEVSTVRRVFYQLSRQTGLRGPSDRRGPRLQDFRHRCATEILLKWYQARRMSSQSRAAPSVQTPRGRVAVIVGCSRRRTSGALMVTRNSGHSPPSWAAPHLLFKRLAGALP